MSSTPFRILDTAERDICPYIDTLPVEKRQYGEGDMMKTVVKTTCGHDGALYKQLLIEETRRIGEAEHYDRPAAGLLMRELFCCILQLTEH